MKFDNSIKLCEYIANINDSCILSFSCGKDSIAAWTQLRNYFSKIIPVYLYLVPELSFVETSLKYFEDKFGTKIIQMPDPSLYRWLNNFVFQLPENCEVIERAELPMFEYEDVWRAIREDYSLDADVHVANGVRQNDSITRRLAIKRYGALNMKKKEFMAIYDWNNQQVEESLKNIKLPVDYKIFGRSFDGIDYRFMKPIKENYPEDYKKIIELFPLVELEFFRRKLRE